jgi:type IV pilus assembly protein PilX
MHGRSKAKDIGMRHVGFTVGNPHRHEHGTVLVVALIFLLLLTLLSISASSHSLLQQRMAGGLRNAQQAEMGAEAALRGAEWRLWTASATGSAMRCGSTVLTDCYLYDASAGPAEAVRVFRSGPGWVASYGTEYGARNGGVDFAHPASDEGNAALAYNPRYLIEDLGPELPPDTGAQHESGASGAGGIGYTSTSRHIYRITARSTGGSANTIRVLESTFSAKGD